jgi:hypothetical protein
MQKLDAVQKHVQDRKRADLGEQERRRMIGADRIARRPVLLDLAQDIFRWRDDFLRTPEGKRYWDLIGAGTRVLLWTGWYWEGLPFPVGNGPGAHTRVFLDGPHHHFLVEDWRNDDAGTPMSYREVCRLTSPLAMLEHPMIHPRMIEELQTHLSGSEAWEMLEQELDRRLARYQTA